MSVTQKVHTGVHHTCLYCGNNQTSHLASHFDTAIAITMSPLFEWFAKTCIGHFLLMFAEYLLDLAWQLLVTAEVVRFNVQGVIPPTDRGKVLYDEAVARGWKMDTAVIFGKAIDVYRLTFPSGKTLNFSGLPRLDAEKSASAGWMDDKAVLKERLSAEGIPVSRGKSFNKWREARDYFLSAEKPVIIKPRHGSRGRHTTTFIYTLEDFKNAFNVAKQLGHFVIVEEHLKGSVYRATMIDGKLAGVLAGDPPRITGDGIRTIAELIEMKNVERHERVSAFVPTGLTEAFLGRQGYTLDTILTKGLTIDLTEKIGLSYGGKSREVTPHVHPKLRAELERAARVVDDSVMGFDFISMDIAADPNTVRWGIIECNAMPFINLHHDPLEGEPVNVAGIFLDYLERETEKAS